MKKNRPAYELCVLCLEEEIPIMEQIIFSNTTTIGIRRCRMERTVLTREIQIVETFYGAARVKICTVLDGENSESVKRCYPEYESIIDLSRKSGKSYQQIYQMIVEEWNKAI